MASLPIDPLLPEIIAAGARIVLRAPTGAGKTTRVPAALLDAGIAGAGEIVVVEPRRIAARAAAEYVARSRGERLGDRVGYRVRLDVRGGEATRLWFVTDGILARRLTHDPFLERVGAIVLDEFHERRLTGDVLLGAIRELQDTVRPDLKLIVMSATLETEALARFLPGATVLTSAGRTHPVVIEHAAAASDRPLAERVAAAAARAVAADAEGDLLVFLPGAAEIRRTAQALEPLAARAGLDVVLLHGDLALDEQRRAIERGPRRRIILSTNVAETSLTVEGVTVVIDSGLAREARFDARHGVNRLRTVRVSRASADQRAGRAGRTAPGRCLRLWTAAEQAERRERETPEVARLELSSAVLELRAWGLRDPASFPWLDPPPPAALTLADRLLLDLGAIDAERGAITALGRRLLELAVEPRIGRILIEAERRGLAASGALLAALASEEDVRTGARGLGPRPLAASSSASSDLLDRFALFEEVARQGLTAAACRALGLEPAAVRNVERTRRALARAIGGSDRQDAGEDDALRAILAGYPDRVARRHEPGSKRATMVGGAVVELAAESVVRDAELFLAIEVEGRIDRRGRATIVRVASAIRREWLDQAFPAARRTEEAVELDAARARVVCRRRSLYRDLVLEESEIPVSDRAAAGEILAGALLDDPEQHLPLDDADRRLLDRLAFLSRSMPELVLPATPHALLEAAIPTVTAGRVAAGEIRAGEIRAALLDQLPAAVRRSLDRHAPEQIPLPSGRSASVRYPAGAAPVAAARLQELFGLQATPRLAGGRVPLVLEILAPNQRPVQVTDDLASFWRTTYAEVRKQLRGRYPRHQWPEDPALGIATRRVRPR